MRTAHQLTGLTGTIMKSIFWALETPTWRATSAADNPNSSPYRRANKARILDTSLRRLPCFSSRVLTPTHRQPRAISPLSFR